MLTQILRQWLTCLVEVVDSLPELLVPGIVLNLLGRKVQRSQLHSPQLVNQALRGRNSTVGCLFSVC